jgi:hypothetical protein
MNCAVMPAPATSTYDAKGNRIEVIEAAGALISRRTTMEYDVGLGAIEWSSDYDFEDSYQKTENSHTHAMTPLEIGRNGWPKTNQRGNAKEIARQRWREFIDANINACTGKNLGFALHAMQDSFAVGHKDFALWPGGIPNLSHIYGDTFPSADAWSSAVLASQQLIDRFIRSCSHVCKCK